MHRCVRLFPLVGVVLCAVAALQAQVTETPQTVAPGAVLVRMDGLRLSLDREDAAGNTYDALAVGSTTLRTGLTSDLDLQLGLDLYLRQTFTIKGRKQRQAGLGDLSVRSKWTFWRDKTLGASAAVMPFVKLPTGADGVSSPAVEGGVIVPWALDNGNGLKFGAMFEWDLLRNPADNGYDSRFFLSGYGQMDLSASFSLYNEATFEINSGHGSDWGATFGAGLLWRLTKHWRLDYELQRGLTGRSGTWTHVFRFDWEW